MPLSLVGLHLLIDPIRIILKDKGRIMVNLIFKALPVLVASVIPAIASAQSAPIWAAQMIDNNVLAEPPAE